MSSKRGHRFDINRVTGIGVGGMKPMATAKGSDQTVSLMIDEAAALTQSQTASAVYPIGNSHDCRIPQRSLRGMAGFSQNISVTSGGNGSMEDPNRKGGNRMSEETQPYMGSNRAS